MKRSKMKLLLKLIQLIECELEEMKYLTSDEPAVGNVQILVKNARKAIVDYIEL